MHTRFGSRRRSRNSKIPSSYLYLSCPLLVLFLSTLGTARGAFLVPSSGGLVKVTQGTKVTVSWTTDWGPDAFLSLAVFQIVVANNASSGYMPQILFNDIKDPGNYTWEAQPLPNLPVANAIHFTVRRGPATDNPEPLKEGYNAFNSGSLLILTDSPTQPEPSSTPGSSDKKDGLSAGDVTTIVGTVVGSVLAVISAVLAYLGLKKNKNGDRYITQRVRGMQRRLRTWRETSPYGSDERALARRRTHS